MQEYDVLYNVHAWSSEESADGMVEGVPAGSAVLANMRQRGAVVSRGKMQIKISNSGKFSDGPPTPSTPSAALGSSSYGVGGGGGGGDSSPYQTLRVSSSMSVVTLRRLQSDGSLPKAARHRTRKAHSLVESEFAAFRDQGAVDEEKQRLLEQRRNSEAREQTLQYISRVRESRKRSLITDLLKESLTTTHVIFPSFGSVAFFELAFHNPYAHQDCFSIEFDDPELRIVRDIGEWRVHKRSRGLTTPEEEDMLSERNELVVEPRETVFIPFAFQSFNSGTIFPSMPSFDITNVRSSSASAGLSLASASLRNMDEAMRERTIPISFYNRDGKLVYVIRLQVRPQPFSVDRTFRFFTGENDFFKNKITMDLTPPPPALAPAFSASHPSLSPSPSAAASPTKPFSSSSFSSLSSPSPSRSVSSRLVPDLSASAMGFRYIRCSHSNVIVRSESTSSTQDINLKYRCGAWPQVARFFLLLYHDNYYALLNEVWQIYVHPMRRHDISSTVGQTSRASLYLNFPTPSSAPRSFHAFSSRPDVLKLSPAGPFSVLPGSSVCEVGISFRPYQVGVLDCLVHVVEVSTHEVVGGWVVHANATPPTISATYDVHIPTGAPLNKKLKWRNEYPFRKTLVLWCSHPQLMSFAEERLEIEPNEYKFISMRFVPSQVPMVAEVHVFINDEEDKGEDCLCLRTTYYAA